MAISNQPGQHIDNKIDRRTVASVLDLGDIFELIIDGLDQGTFAKQKLIGHNHQAVLHVLAQLGNQLDMVILPELFKEFPGNVAAITKQLAKESFG